MSDHEAILIDLLANITTEYVAMGEDVPAYVRAEMGVDALRDLFKGLRRARLLYEAEHGVQEPPKVDGGDGGAKNRNLEFISKEDHHAYVTKADFKRWRHRTLQDITGILQAFQRDLIGGQGRTNTLWNAINAVIRSFANRGMINNEDVGAAGRELMAEANAHLAVARRAADEKRKIQPGEIKPTPIEVIGAAIYPNQAAPVEATVGAAGGDGVPA